MAIQIDKLTLGEVDKIETLAGVSISQLGDDETPKGKMLAALAFIAKRREELAAGTPPKFSWNDALGLTFEEANGLIGLDASAESDAATSTEEGGEVDPSEHTELHPAG